MPHHALNSFMLLQLRCLPTTSGPQLQCRVSPQHSVLTPDADRQMEQRCPLLHMASEAAKAASQGWEHGTLCAIDCL